MDRGFISLSLSGGILTSMSPRSAGSRAGSVAGAGEKGVGQRRRRSARGTEGFSRRQGERGISQCGGRGASLAEQAKGIKSRARRGGPPDARRLAGSLTDGSVAQRSRAVTTNSRRDNKVLFPCHSKRPPSSLRVNRTTVLGHVRRHGIPQAGSVGTLKRRRRQGQEALRRGAVRGLDRWGTGGDGEHGRTCTAGHRHRLADAGTATCGEPIEPAQGPTS